MVVRSLFFLHFLLCLGNNGRSLRDVMTRLLPTLPTISTTMLLRLNVFLAFASIIYYYLYAIRCVPTNSLTAEKLTGQKEFFRVRVLFAFCGVNTQWPDLLGAQIFASNIFFFSCYNWRHLFHPRSRFTFLLHICRNNNYLVENNNKKKNENKMRNVETVGVTVDDGRWISDLITSATKN